MMNVLSSHPLQNLKLGVVRERRGLHCPSPSAGTLPLVVDPRSRRSRHDARPLVLLVTRAISGESGEDDDKQERSGSSRDREDLERLVGPDDAKFNGLALANLIRNKYGRSYDVTLIKKEFMGRNLLAMNVMWKYREQKSFPLSEEEYLLRLDDVANTLKCWGAVSHVRNTLEKLKDRPRIGKAVSIFIDMDETGGRSNEWIYK